MAAGGVDGSQLECEVLACCREMLGGDYTEKCGLATELEESGLNSLSAVDLALWLRDVFGVALPPSLVTEYPTARAIAARILQLQEVANQQAEAEAARGLDSAVAAAAPAASGGRRQAARWLTALRGYMLLRWRQLIGGSQLLDGIEMRDLLIGHMLGEGMYGQVYLARHRIMPDRWYAVKRQNIGRLKAQGAKGKRQLRCLEREREVLLLLARESRGTNDRNLCVQLITHQQDAHALTLVMVAVLGGELFDLLAETGPMTLEEVRFYAACLVSALQLSTRGGSCAATSSRRMCCCRVATFRAAGGRPRRFGAHAVVHDGSSLHTFCGTPAFIAPEMAAQVGYGTAADWWSLGVLIYQCFTCATPFEGPNAWATLDNIVRGRRVHGLAAADPPVELPECGLRDQRAAPPRPRDAPRWPAPLERGAHPPLLLGLRLVADGETDDDAAALRPLQAPRVRGDAAPVAKAAAAPAALEIQRSRRSSSEPKHAHRTDHFKNGAHQKSRATWPAAPQPRDASPRLPAPPVIGQPRHYRARRGGELPPHPARRQQQPREHGPQLAVPRLRAPGDRRPLVGQRPADAEARGDPLDEDGRAADEDALLRERLQDLHRRVWRELADVEAARERVERAVEEPHRDGGGALGQRALFELDPELERELRDLRELGGVGVGGAVGQGHHHLPQRALRARAGLLTWPKSMSPSRPSSSTKRLPG